MPGLRDVVIYRFRIALRVRLGRVCTLACSRSVRHVGRAHTNKHPLVFEGR